MPSPVKKFTLTHLLYFIFLNIIMTTDTGFTAPLITKISTIFSVTVSEISWLISIMAITAAAFMPLWGYLADKLNRVHLIFAITLVGAIIHLVTAFTITARAEFWVFGLMRFLAVIDTVAVGPAVYTLITDMVPASQRGVIIGWIGFAGTLGIGTGIVVSGVMPTIFYGENFPLEFPFLFDFFGGVLFCVLTVFIKEPARGAHEEGLKELQGREATRLAELTTNRWSFFKKSVNLMLLSFQFLCNVVSTALGTYFITFLVKQYAVPTSIATLLMMGIFGIELLSQVLWGGAGDRRYRSAKNGRSRLMIVIMGIGGCFLIPAFLIPFNFQDRSWMFALFAIMLATGSFFVVGTSPNLNALVADVNFPEVRGSINSIVLISQTAATAIFSPLFAFLAEATPLNYSGSFFIFMATCIPIAFVILIAMKGLIVPNIDAIQAELQRRASESVA
ncbi:MAG TPA: MFS transporter [Candidatus Lokiarchaeia archaeon]|nr:MFS transporter [Candidatus Lokiarchaeia archaeon]